MNIDWKEARIHDLSSAITKVLVDYENVMEIDSIIDLLEAQTKILSAYKRELKPEVKDG